MMQIVTKGDYTNLHFSHAVLAAFLLHAAGFLIYYWTPKTTVFNVPVRALNLKIGEGEDLLVPPTDFSKQVPRRASSRGESDAIEADSSKQSQEKSGKASPVTGENQQKAQRFVRAATESTPGQPTKAQRETMARYEQLISASIQRYKSYPPEARAEGLEGEGILRLRINRQGRVQRAVIERSTGHRMLDEALIGMAKLADPVPEVPEDYPGGYMIEFLIPVHFALQ